MICSLQNQQGIELPKQMLSLQHMDGYVTLIQPESPPYADGNTAPGIEDGGAAAGLGKLALASSAEMWFSSQG